MQRWVDYNHAFEELSSLPAERRLPRLLVEYGGSGMSLSIDELRRLFIYAWADGASPPDQDREVLRLLRWIAPVRDVERYLSGTHIVYSGAAGNENAIRWTLDEQVARQEFGDDLVRGEVESNEVLAHLSAGGKNHVLVDPDEVGDVRPV
jgi:hypothetical protein